MNGNDLMERRVERGTPRGALIVLADAQAVVDLNDDSSQRSGSQWFFKISFVLYIVVALGVSFFNEGVRTEDLASFNLEPDRTIVGPTALTLSLIHI